MKNSYELDMSAIHHIRNHSFFTIVGVLEHLDKFIEMLECIYPNTFKGITKLYEEEHTHSRTTHVNESYEVVKKYISDVCQSSPIYNSYPPVYKEAVRIFLERYNYMKTHRSSCCRKAINL